MSQQCYKLHQLQKSAYFHRHISTTRIVLAPKEDGSKKSDSAENKKDDEGTQGFFARFKSELMKDIESNQENKETLSKYREQFEKLNSKYDSYKETIRKYVPESTKSEKFESEERTKKHKIYVEKLKSRLEKDQLMKDYDSLRERMTNKTVDLKKRWDERNVKPPVEEGSVEGTVEEKPKLTANMRTKFQSLYDRSGISENPIFMKARDRTKTVFEEHEGKLSGVSKAAADAVSKSKAFTEKFSSRSKEYSESLKGETKEAVEKFGWHQKSKEALDMSKKAIELTEQMAKETAERVAKETEELQKSEKFKKVSEATQETLKTAATAAEDFYDTTKLKESETYKSPEQLKKRIEKEEEEGEEGKDPQKVKVNEDATGVVEHKGWKWESSWKNFKEQNPLIQKMMDVRESLEESDNIFARAGYKVIDSVHGVFAGMLQPSDISNTIAEIQKMDSEFDITRFSTVLRSDIVPYVIEAYLRGDMEILESWCQERALGQFTHMIAARQFKGSIHLIDIGDCDIVAGSMLDLGPVFMFNVSTQQLFRTKITASTGDGDVTQDTEDTIKQVVYTIAVCRDQTMFDATAAWRVLEIIEHVTHEKYF